MRIQVPISFIILILICVTLFSPIYPTQIRKMKWESPCPPYDNLSSVSEYLQLNPPILVLTSNFHWSADISDVDGCAIYAISASPWIFLLFLSLAIAVPLIILFMKSDKTKIYHITLSRRLWRIILWAIGFYLLILGAYWAWNYTVFYGVAINTATIDPFFISLIATFLLSGLGLTLMMLAVRSRALWPVRNDHIK
ncbi:MAG: hypothetical protein ACFFDT_23035 [Candidatus Hodarchaeota archaeon]